MVLPTEGGGGTTAPVTTTLSRQSAGRVVAAIAGTAADALSFGANVTVACLSAEPTLDTVTGTWSIAGRELSGNGYSRITIARQAGFTGAYGSAPVRVSNSAQAVSGIATAAWPSIVAVALIDSLGAVVTWKPLDAPVNVAVGEQARIPIEGLLFSTPSV